MGGELILPTIQILSAALTQGHVMGSESNSFGLASSGLDYWACMFSPTNNNIIKYIVILILIIDFDFHVSQK